jgi:DNA-binding NarL/FixJ family response regulator
VQQPQHGQLVRPGQVLGLLPRQRCGRPDRAAAAASACTDTDSVSAIRSPSEVDPTRVPTAREREVAELVERALSSREIAAELVLSERTVESHVRSILAKLGHANRAELIAARR